MRGHETCDGACYPCTGCQDMDPEGYVGPCYNCEGMPFDCFGCPYLAPPDSHNSKALIQEIVDLYYPKGGRGGIPF